MIARSRRMHSDDTGTVMMLVIGLVPILLLMVAVATDAAVLFSHKRSLAAEADAAAVAAAQSADLAALYSGRELHSLPLDCTQARRVVNMRVGGSASDSRVGNATVAEMTCTRTEVSVSLSSRVELPFSQYLGFEPTVAVRASSAARSPLR